MDTIEDAVRAWAKGIYPVEAGAELLIRQGRVYEHAPWITELDPPPDDRPRMAAIDHDELLNESGAWSGGERRLTRIAASLLGGPPVALADDLTGLDQHNLALVLAAVAHANGSHEASSVDLDDDGTPRFVQRGSLYPWPQKGN